MPNFPVLMLFCYLFKRLDWGSLLFSSRGSTLTQNKVFFGLIIPTTCIPCTIIAAMVHIHLTDDQENKAYGPPLSFPTSNSMSILQCSIIPVNLKLTYRLF